MTSFFDFHEKITRESHRPTGASAKGKPPEPLSVSALTRQIDQAIRSALPARVYVRGQLSNTRLHTSSGHLYFTLKDEGASLSGVMWKSDCARLKFQPTDGLEVIASGSIKIFPQRGAHQLYATTLQPLGQGALEIAFQQMCRKLQAEGLFDPQRKKPLPPYPMRIALVTGASTAALADMLKVLRRYPWLQLGVYPVPVQGEGSGDKIAAAIRHLSQSGPAAKIEVIVLARGGGSLEDRWAFNEEAVARAIAQCRLPVVTGIGHEVDVSVADLVADYHAHTPTEAAQVIVGQWRLARDNVGNCDLRLRRGISQHLRDARQRLGSIQQHEVFRRPLDRIVQYRQTLDENERALLLVQRQHLANKRRYLDHLAGRLDRHRPVVVATRLHERLTSFQARIATATRNQLRRYRHQIEAAATHLHAIGPQQVLKRGYSITTLKKTQAVIRSASQIKPGDQIITRLADGQIESTAGDPNQPGLFDS